MQLRSHNVGLAAIVLRLIQPLTQIKYTEKKDSMLTFQKKVKGGGGRADGSRARGLAHVDKEEKSLVRKLLRRCFLNREGIGAGEEGSGFL